MGRDTPDSGPGLATQRVGGDRSGCRAFTLIELLVVVGIISVMLAIALPVMRHARSTAHAVQCQSNQRQLVIATSMYLSDTRGSYPQPSHDNDITDATGQAGTVAAYHLQGELIWFNALDPYLHQQRLAYSRNNAEERNYASFKQDPVWLRFAQADQDRNRTIKMNAFFGHTTSESPTASVRFVRDQDLRQPARTVLFVDGRADDTPSITTGNTGGRDLFHATEIYVGLRHRGGANVAFADGHVAHAVQPVRQTAAGYRGWYNGDNGPQAFIWRIDEP